MQHESIKESSEYILSETAKKARVELTKVYENGEDLTMLISQEKNQHELVLPSDVVFLLLEILDHLSLHKSVSVIASDKMLSTQQVADILRVSRPFITKLIDKGDLSCSMVGTHRRIKFEDVMEFKARIDSDRRKALDELTKQAQELNMGY